MDHPRWCEPGLCTAGTPPVNGHGIAAHRGHPHRAGQVRAQLRQSPGAAEPSIVLSRNGSEFYLPLVEAAAVWTVVDGLVDEVHGAR